jgi:cytochrome c oxidase subunit II
MKSLARAAGSVALFAPALSACEGPQNMLDAGGIQADRIAGMWWFMLAVTGVVWLLVVLAMLAAVWRRRVSGQALDLPGEPKPERRERGLGIMVAGAVAVTVAILFVFTISSFLLERRIFAAPPEDALEIQVTGHQWWWQVRYMDPDPSKIVETANEIHIPVGRKVAVRLSSPDVIHSFWVPALHGKRDLIPGQAAIFWIQADRPGSYRGQCAEFCGWQHAHMSFWVHVEEPEAFQAWLDQQRRPAPEPPDDLTRRGRDVFVTGPCAMCHAISGTTASARFGPDLTHVASRTTLAAGTLPNTRGHLAAWISDPQAFKPGNRMPPTFLPPEELQALLAYLETLR